MNTFKRINYRADDKNSSMTIDRTLYELIEAYNGDATKWCRDQAVDFCKNGGEAGKISASVRENAIHLVASPALMEKVLANKEK